MIVLDTVQKRLLTLFAFDEVGVRISKEQIASVLLNNSPLSWFDLQLTISGLIEDNLLSENEENKKLALTTGGSEIVKVYSNQIPERMRENIREYIKKNRDELLREVTVFSHFTKQDYGYVVELRLTENGLVLMDLSLTATTRELAEKICSNFKEKPNIIYNTVINGLSS